MPEQEDSQKSPEALDLARRIQYWRQRAGLARRIDLARAIGVEPSMVTKWETAVNKPTIEHHHKVCEACGISMQMFWSRIPDEEGEAAEC